MICLSACFSSSLPRLSLRLLPFLSFFARRRAVAYFKTREGLGVLKGIALFAVGVPAVVLFITFLLGLFGSKAAAGEYFAFGDLYLGLDNTNKPSPMCEDGDNSSRLTSNGGLIANIYRSDDQRFQLNTKYTHHSCAFNADDKSYDALGLEVRYRLWGR